jgi:alpha-galactosidase
MKRLHVFPLVFIALLAVSIVTWQPLTRAAGAAAGDLASSRMLGVATPIQDSTIPLSPPGAASPVPIPDGGAVPLPLQPENQALVPMLQLALTPPMGWNSWNYFHRDISDAIIRAQADAIVSSGLRAAGYIYLNMDDGWEGARDEKGFIQANAKFPDMKALAAYVHSKGLKLGIYSSPGPKTCAGFEGSYQHEAQDAQQFANWGIDYLKYDWCSARNVYKTEEMPAVYARMGQELRKTGRPIVYSLCEYGMDRVWTWGPSVGAQLWRTTIDIEPRFDRIGFIAFGQNGLEKYAGPGHWNDPDMLEVGNGTLTEDENRAHMTLWCMLAAPLIVGTDVTKLTPAVKAILTNADVIAVDQDRAGVQARLISQEGPLQIWLKPLADGTRAVAVFNAGQSNTLATLNFIDAGMDKTKEVHVRDVWSRIDLGTFNDSYATHVPKHGAMLFRLY